MTLLDGGALLGTGISEVYKPLPILDGLNFGLIIECMIFLAVISWFVARMIKGKSFNEHAITKEDSTPEERVAENEARGVYAGSYEFEGE